MTSVPLSVVGAKMGNLSFYLHVVCEHTDPVYIEIVTAYIPDESEWEWPPVRRRRR
jgi:hypothetical protein